MNKLTVGDSFEITQFPKNDDFLSHVQNKLKDNGFTTHRHDHGNQFSLLKISVTKTDGEYSHQVYLYHDHSTSLVETVHQGTGASENSAHISQITSHEASDLALGFCAFLSLNEDTSLRKDLENMMNKLPRAGITETTLMPSQQFQEFQSRRAAHVNLHPV